MLGGIVETQWHDVQNKVKVHTPEGALIDVPESYIILNELFGSKYTYAHRWIDVGALIGFSAGTLILLWLSLRFGRMATR